MTSKFVVVNEFQPRGSDNTSVEIIAVLSDYDKAWNVLANEAVKNDTYVRKDEDSFSIALDEDTHLEFDEFMILEFTEDEYDG